MSEVKYRELLKSVHEKHEQRVRKVKSMKTVAADLVTAIADRMDIPYEHCRIATDARGAPNFDELQNGALAFKVVVTFPDGTGNVILEHAIPVLASEEGGRVRIHYIDLDNAIVIDTAPGISQNHLQGAAQLALPLIEKAARTFRGF